jgi:glycosyltransferase involved in cell wall biosynthesis
MQGLMRTLARSHAVSIVSFVNPAQPHEASMKATREYCREVVVVPNQAFAVSQSKKRLHQLRSLASRRSFEWLSHVQPGMLAKLREVLAHERWDVVNFEYSFMAPYRAALGADGAAGARAFVLDEHNIEYEILRRTAAAEASLPRRLYNTVNWRKLYREEVRAWRFFDGCTVTSSVDQQLLLRDVPDATTEVVPNAADVDYFRPRSDAPPPQPMSLLFFGAFNYFPNAEGLRFFVNEVLPLLAARCPGIKLKVVGHTPEGLLSLASDHVEMVGFVDDLRAYLERAAVVIAPLRVGGGTRLKILEAMAMGKAVVSTRLGAEGLEVADGRELLLADGAAAFADQVARALEDSALSSRLGAAARRLVEERYSWQESVQRLEAFYDRLLFAARGAA